MSEDVVNDVRLRLTQTWRRMRIFRPSFTMHATTHVGWPAKWIMIRISEAELGLFSQSLQKSIMRNAMNRLLFFIFSLRHDLKKHLLQQQQQLTNCFHFQIQFGIHFHCCCCRFTALPAGKMQTRFNFRVCFLRWTEKVCEIWKIEWAPKYFCQLPGWLLSKISLPAWETLWKCLSVRSKCGQKLTFLAISLWKF